MIHSLVTIFSFNRTLREKMSRIVRKPDFCLGENKGADPAKLISAFVFTTRIVQFLFYLNLKFQASSSFLSLYRPVCVGPGRKPRRAVFSCRGSNDKNSRFLRANFSNKIVMNKNTDERERTLLDNIRILYGVLF